MLKDQVKKAEARSIERTGACRFCGQMATVRVLKEFTDEETDELATELCECPEASYYSMQKGRKERAHERINTLFADENLTEDEMKFLHRAVKPIVGGWIEKMSIDVTEILKMTINQTAKGNIKITKKKSISSSQEV